MKWSLRSLLLGLLAGSAFVSAPPCLDAQSTNSCIAVSDAKWETALNWSLNVAPVSSQGAVLITNAPGKAVTIDGATPAANRTVSNLVVSVPNTLQLTNAGSATPVRVLNNLAIGVGGAVLVTDSVLRVDGLAGLDGALRVAGGSLFVTNASGNATLDVRGGTLTFDGGAIIADRLVVTNNPGRLFFNTGSLTTRGTTVSNAFAFVVGDSASLNLIAGNHTFSEALIVTNGGALTVTNCTLRAQSALGFFMDGVVNLLSGATIVTTNAGTYVGAFQISSAGTLTVNGGTLLAANMFVGQYFQAQGNLYLQSGTVTLLGNLSAGIGGATTSTGTLVIAGGQLAATNGTTTLGDKVGIVPGLAQMTVLNGAVSLRDVLLGKGNNSEGSLTAAGGTTTISSTLTVGNCANGARGTVVVSGGSLFVTNAAHTAVLEVRNGSVTVNAGTLVVDKLVVTNACGAFIHNGGALIVGTLVLDPNLDADGDGIPNDYEQAHGLDPFDPGNATKDSDGDGLTDLQEFLAGTDATNSALSFRIISIARVDTNVLVTWMMGSGKTNALERSAGDGSGNFMTNNFATIFTVTNTVGTTTNYLDVGGATNVPSRYYRVRLVP